MLPVNTRVWASRVLALMALACWGAPANAQCECPGDATNDGAVNVDDLLLVVNGWGPTAEGNPADFDANAVIDINDLLVVINGWDQVCPAGGVFAEEWIHGAPSCSPQPLPLIQVHQYNANTYILRQSKCTNFEGPFIYLLFGQNKVLMQDTGASNVPMASTVYGIINQWLQAHGQQSIQLIVTHSHGHGDHTFCDNQFIGQPNTTVVGTSQTAVRNFFGITSWPTQIVSYDLGGGRVIDVIPIPGHQSAHIALYDRQTGILFTGDTLYPGRLYISNFTDYRDSIERLVNFTNENPVCWVLGTHIEMTNVPGVDYPIGSTYQPNEHALQLTRDHLLELHKALVAMGNQPQYEVHDDFIIYPLGVLGLAEPPCCAGKHATADADAEDDAEDVDEHGVRRVSSRANSDRFPLLSRIVVQNPTNSGVAQQR